jgi:hypothetical protein
MKSEKDQTDHRSAEEKWMEKLSPAEVSELLTWIVDLMAGLEVIDFMRHFALLDHERECMVNEGMGVSISEELQILWEWKRSIEAYQGLKAAMQRMGIYQELKPAMQRMGIYYPYTWNQLVEGADAETTAELAEQARRDAEVAKTFEM